MTGRFAGLTLSFIISTLILSLVGGLLCGIAQADDPIAGKSLRIRTAVVAPIGRIYSVGEISVNGRKVYGEQMIWGCELLQVYEFPSASVVLDSIGQVTLKRGTTVKLATRLTGAAERRLLVASLISGDMIVQLERDARAYIDGCGSVFSSSGDAIFRLAIRHGEAFAEVGFGLVRVETQTRRIYILTRVDPKYDPNRPGAKPPVKDLDKTRTGEKVTIANLVKFVDKGTTNQQVLFVLGGGTINGQTGVEQPAIGKRVRFTLSNPIGELSQIGGPTRTGSQSIVVTTDRRGVGTVIFTAGRNPDSAEITGTVEDLAQNESAVPWIGHITIIKAGFWTRNKILLAAAAVAGTFVIIVHRPKKPIEQRPPPQIP